MRNHTEKNLWNDFKAFLCSIKPPWEPHVGSFPGLVQGFAWCSSRLNLGFGGSRYLSWIWVMGSWMGDDWVVVLHVFISIPTYLGKIFFCLSFLFFKGGWNHELDEISWVCNAVDGRNPASVHIVNIPLSTRFYTSQVVRDCFHQQYETDFTRQWHGKKSFHMDAMYTYSYSHIFNFLLRLWFHIAAASCEFCLRPKFSSESSRILGNFHKLDGFCRIFTKSSRIVFSLKLSKTKNKSYILKVPRQGAKLEWGSIWHCFC